MNTSLHPLHRAWRALPMGLRRGLLARGTALLAPRATQPPPPACAGVVVGGELSRASGLGEGARLMLRGLEALGVPHWGVEAGLRLPGEGGDSDVARPIVGAPLLLHVNAPQVPLALLRLPRGLARGRRVIGHWAWELPAMPPEWRMALPCVHDIWAPSRFTAAALETITAGRPVRVVPYPIACQPPVASALGRADFGLPAEAVVVLVSFSLASSFERKNPLAAIAAHRQAFGDRADRVLLLKLANTRHYETDLHRLRDAIGDAPNIRLETRTLPLEDAHALTQAADIVMSLHRSEGFGLIPAEAMLLRRPVVATGWSGNMDFMDADCAALVNYTLVPARDPRGVFQAPGAVWAEPDIRDAALQLRRLADDAALRRRMGEAGRQSVLDRLGTAPLADALRAIGWSPTCVS